MVFILWILILLPCPVVTRRGYVEPPLFFLRPDVEIFMKLFHSKKKETADP